MAQFESLVLPCVISITVALIWVMLLIMDTPQKTGKYFIMVSSALAFISIVLFIISLFYIIQNITLEAPTKFWAGPFIWGWIILSVSFVVIYSGYSSGFTGQGTTKVR